jgi:hypothetical protein
VNPKLFVIDPDPTFLRVQGPDPTLLSKSSGAGSDPVSIYAYFIPIIIKSLQMTLIHNSHSKLVCKVVAKSAESGYPVFTLMEALLYGP